MYPNTRKQVAKVYPYATASTAGVFPHEAVKRIDIRTMQVDDGSKFTACFEEECKRRSARRYRVTSTTPAFLSWRAIPVRRRLPPRPATGQRTRTPAACPA